MYHYTYIITYTDDKQYIGVRTSKCLPELDTKYIGSSKHTPNELFKSKKILNIFNTRKEAVADEIRLHNLYSVSTSENFYNKAKQTSVGFDTSGTKLTDEHKEYLSRKFKNRIISNEHKQRISESLTGRKRTDEEIKNIKLGINKAMPNRKPRIVSDEERQRKSERLKGIPTGRKGEQYDKEYRLDKYASRVKHPNKYEWINTTTKQTEFKTCQEMGIDYGTRRKSSKQFIDIVNGIAKSYLKWTLLTMYESGSYKRNG